MLVVTNSSGAVGGETAPICRSGVAGGIWRERGGPAVRKPDRGGFGARLIAASVKHEFAGTVQTDFLESGLVCSMTLPLSERLTGPAPTIAETNWSSLAPGVPAQD